MSSNYLAILFLALLGNRRKKTIRLTADFDKYLSRKGCIKNVIYQMWKISGCLCIITVDRDKGRFYIKNTDTYITKESLSARWSMKLIKMFFPTPTLTKPNPHYIHSSPMCLYSMAEIKRIEEREDFQREFSKVAERKAMFLQRERRRSTIDDLKRFESR